MLRRLRTSLCCACINSIDLELGPTDARVADEPRIEPDSTKKTETVRRFTWPEIVSATADFSTSAIIGEGGFSTVYIARLDDEETAVKLHRSSERLNRAFRQELDVVRRLHHPNIVRLIGFCDDREEGILIFEHIQNGSVHDNLHDVSNAVILSWAQRMKIAYDVVGALDYLHDGCEFQIIHGDVKSSNILLDEMMNAKVIDFGFARMGFSAAVTPPAGGGCRQMMGSPGYVDPHYLRSGLASKKSDVYSFGVLVLELITGMEAIVTDKGQRLTAVIAPMITGDDRTAASELVDRRLGGCFDCDEAAAMVVVAAACVGDNPSLRPSMGDVLRIMRERVSASISALEMRSNVAKKKCR